MTAFEPPEAFIQAGNAQDIDRAVQAAWTAYDEQWADTSPAERQRILEAIADRVEETAEAFARLEVLDNGKPITEARVDMDLVADHFRYFAGAARVNEGMTLPSDDTRHVETLREPYGVVGQIIPWNFPLLMAANFYLSASDRSPRTDGGNGRIFRLFGSCVQLSLSSRNRRYNNWAGRPVVLPPCSLTLIRARIHVSASGAVVSENPDCSSTPSRPTGGRFVGDHLWARRHESVHSAVFTEWNCA